MFLTKTKKSRYYQIIFFKDGKQSSKSTHTTDKKTAELILKSFQKTIDEYMVSSPPGQSIKLKKFSEEYIELISLSTTKAYVNRSVIPSFKHLQLYFGNIQLDKITPQKAEKFLLEHFQKAKYSASLYHRVLKAAFRKALNWNYIESNPFLGIRLPKIQRKEIKFITVEELRLIVDNTEKQVLKDIFMFAFLTGMRLSEILNLCWEQVNLEKNIIQVGSDNFITKSRKIRFIPISIPAKKILLNRRPKKIIHTNYLIFDKMNGFRFSNDYVSKKFKKAVRKSGLAEEIHFHSLRASFGSFLLQEGVPISHISKLLGHSSISVTEKHYTELQLSDMLSAVHIFNLKWQLSPIIEGTQ